MRTLTKCLLAGVILSAGLILLTAESPLHPQQVQLNQKAIKKIQIDPNRIAMSGPREFTLTSPNMGTRPYGEKFAAAGAYRGYAFVYQGVVDEIDGGHVQTLFFMRDRDMNPLNGPTPLAQKTTNSQLKSVHLLRIPGQEDKFLCVYVVYINNVNRGFYRIIDPFTMGRFGNPHPIGRQNENVTISNVRFLPGKATAMILYNTPLTSRYLVIDMEGNVIHNGRPGNSGESASQVKIADIGFAPDGQWMLAGLHDGLWGYRNMDPYGVWASAILRFPEIARAEIHTIDQILNNRIFIRYGHHNAAFLSTVSNSTRIISRPQYEKMVADYAEYLKNDRIMLFYMHRTNHWCDLEAQVVDYKGNVLKPPQNIFTSTYGCAGFGRRWGHRDEFTVFVPVAEADPARFRYVTIRE